MKSIAFLCRHGNAVQPDRDGRPDDEDAAAGEAGVREALRGLRPQIRQSGTRLAAHGGGAGDPR